MKKGTPLAILLSIFFLTACNNPIVIPANVAVTLPANQDFILHATVAVEAAAAEQATPTAASTVTTTPTPEPSLTPTPTATFTPVPTRKSPYPAAAGSAMIDMGFQPITIDAIPQVGVVFNAVSSDVRYSTVSRDGQFLFLETTDGLFQYDRQGNLLGHWAGILPADIACESCLSANRDGSQVALITRSAGTWQAQLYQIQNGEAVQLLAVPVESSYQGITNEASVALSPDATLIAFKAGTGKLRVLDLATKLQVLDYDRTVTGLVFTPDGSRLVIHGGQEMLFYPVDTWKAPANLLLPREDTPFTFSADGTLLGIALPTKMRIFSVDRLNMLREINVGPSNFTQRQWQIAFSDNQTLNGYAVTWDGAHASATVETGRWNIQDGSNISFETTTSETPDALGWLWGTSVSLPSSLGELEKDPAAYQALRFVSDGLLMVNSPHSACWLKLLTGESTCFAEPGHVIFATDGSTFTEMLDTSSTNLVDRAGQTSISFGPYRVAAINHTGDWALIDNGSGTDLYTRGKKLPQESVKGSPQGFAENQKLIVFTAREKENTFTITVVDKASGDSIYQKKDNFLYKPILMLPDGTIYYLQNELGQNQTIINMIEPKSLQVSEVARFSLPALPVSFTLGANGLFAIGMQDGSVMAVGQDGTQTGFFQAASSAVEGVAFSPDGRFLAVACREGVRVYALIPGR